MTQIKNVRNLGFKIQGMSCSSCSNSIEKKLNSLDGIIKASVNIATEKGQVEYDSNTIDIQAILKGVEDAGYKAILDEEKSTEKVTLKIKGMTCTACASQVEKSLSKVEGIIAANVNFAVEKITVKYDPKKVRLIDMQKKVSDLGYELEDSSVIPSSTPISFNT